MSIENEIISKLQRAFAPEILEVSNESYKHAGHVGNPDGKGDTHFKIIISSRNISGTTRLEKHRKIIEALGEIAKTVHSVEIKIID